MWVLSMDRCVSLVSVIIVDVWSVYHGNLPLCWSSKHHIKCKFCKEPFLFLMIWYSWLWIVLCTVCDSGANVPVSRNVIGTRVGKENFVGIPWSWILLIDERGIHTKLGNGKQGYPLAMTGYSSLGRILLNSPAKEALGMRWTLFWTLLLSTGSLKVILNRVSF